jgi:RNA polymerase sigma factor for flagellar operon FliA
MNGMKRKRNSLQSGGKKKHNRLNRNQLIVDHLTYPWAIAAKLRRMLPAGLDFEELAANGSQGLVEAAEHYDPARGVPFTTFAYYRIRGAIFDGIKRLNALNGEPAATIYLPPEEAEEQRSDVPYFTASDLQGCYAQSSLRRGPLPRCSATREGDPQEVAGELNSNHGSQVALEELQSFNGWEWVEHRDTQLKLHHAVAKLPERQRHVLLFYYFKEQSMQAVGQALGISKSWCSRLHARAIDALAQELKAIIHEQEPEDDSP